MSDCASTGTKPHRCNSDKGHDLNIPRLDTTHESYQRDEVLELREDLLEWGRDELGHPCTWQPEDPSDTDLRAIEQEGPTHCPTGLHPAGDLYKTQCRGCWNLWRRRTRAEKAGRPLCWTAEHPEPTPGRVCSCGEPPPPETWCDWAAVDAVIVGRAIPRTLTPAEELSAMRTVMLRYGGGMYEAATWLADFTELRLDDRRVEYLLDEWQPRTGHVVRSISELMEYEFQDQTTALTEAKAAA